MTVPSTDNATPTADNADIGGAARPPAVDAALGIAGIEFIGEATFPTGFSRFDTQIGGLSGITYDPVRGLYYTLSDDRSDARFYTVRIDLSDGALDDGDVIFTGVSRLTDHTGEPFPDGGIDPEGIALTNHDTVFIASEGDARQLIPPFVDEFTLGGTLIRELPLGDTYAPDPGQVSGIRNNLAFESATVSPDNSVVSTAVENALIQDGPVAGIDDTSWSRIRQWDARSGEPLGEVVYAIDAVPAPPADAGGFATNGLVELLAVDNAGTLLALERSFADGVGNGIRLYQTTTSAASNVIDVPSLLAAPVVKEAKKSLVLDLAALGIALDNIEGMTWGPELADGRASLIMVSDNNFNDTQVTQFLAFAVDVRDDCAHELDPDWGTLEHGRDTPFGIDDGPACGDAGNVDDGASLDVFPMG